KLITIATQLELGLPRLIVQMHYQGQILYTAQLSFIQMKQVFTNPQPSLSRRKAVQDVVVHTYEWFIKFLAMRKAEQPSSHLGHQVLPEFPFN
ncbi:hypothetical protein Ciccas_011100, partial [Cichlidogyrus casuarinus]